MSMRQKTLYIYEDNFYLNTLQIEDAKIGAQGILVEHYDENNGCAEWTLNRDNGGIGGNMNMNMKRYHGWRGTINGTAIYAHGLREIIKVSEVMTEKETGREYVKVTVGKDLHPDWE